MGDPRKQRKKYTTPQHPWQKTRIDEEKGLVKAYGLKNKKEIWSMDSVLRKLASQAKRLTSLTSKQAEIEKSQFLSKIYNLGLIEKNAPIEDVLTITLKDILERRLQTLVYKKNLSRSINQARQFIIHRHVVIGDTLITQPSYIVTKDEENKISFTSLSALNDGDHPERAQEDKEKKKKVKKKPRGKKK